MTGILHRNVLCSIAPKRVIEYNDVVICDDIEFANGIS